MLLGYKKIKDLIYLEDKYYAMIAIIEFHRNKYQSTLKKNPRIFLKICSKGTNVLFL